MSKLAQSVQQAVDALKQSSRVESPLQGGVEMPKTTKKATSKKSGTKKAASKKSTKKSTTKKRAAPQAEGASMAKKKNGHVPRIAADAVFSVVSGSEDKASGPRQKMVLEAFAELGGSGTTAQVAKAMAYSGKSDRVAVARRHLLELLKLAVVTTPQGEPANG